VLEQDQAPVGSRDALETELAPDDAIPCASCGVPITRRRDRVERFGGHVHDRVNPTGVAFRIGCFAEAAGVRDVGDESREFPWFPGHRWTIVVCSGCRVHLGWRFEGQGGRFWGLVLDRLRLG
jgi:hypothetical protein